MIVRMTDEEPVDCSKVDDATMTKVNGEMEKRPQEEIQPIFHVNKFSYDRYSTIKSAGVGLLAVALIVDAAGRIRRVVDYGPESKWYLPMIIMLSILLGLLVVEGILLMVLGTQNVENSKKQHTLKKANILCTVFAGLIAILNIIVLQIMGDAGIYTDNTPMPNSNLTMEQTPPTADPGSGWTIGLE